MGFKYGATYLRFGEQAPYTGVHERIVERWRCPSIPSESSLSIHVTEREPRSCTGGTHGVFVASLEYLASALVNTLHSIRNLLIGRPK